MTTPTTTPAAGKAPVRPDRLPNPADDHFLGLDANPVATEAVRETESVIKHTLAVHGMACIHGEVGHGKTFAAHAACRKLAPDTTLTLQFAEAPNLAQIRSALWRALDQPGDAPYNNADLCDQHIKDALASSDRLLLLDEVQHLGHTALEYIRNLWDSNQKTSKTLTVIMIGSGNTRQKILHRKAFHNRIHQWQQFSPLTPAEVLGTIPHYHRLWHEAPDDLLLWADDRACHGCFRTWANLTLVLRGILDDDPTQTLNQHLIRKALRRLDPTTRFPSHDVDRWD